MGIHLIEADKELPNILFFNADAGVLHLHGQPDSLFFFLRLHGQPDIALLGKFDGISNDIDKYLLHPHHITHKKSRYASFCLHHEIHRFFPQTYRRNGGEVIQERAHLILPLLNCIFAGFHLGKIQNVINNIQKALARFPDGLHGYPLRFRQIRPEQQLADSQNHVHRRSDFMAHIGKKHAFHLRCMPLIP